MFDALSRVFVRGDIDSSQERSCLSTQNQSDCVKALLRFSRYLLTTAKLVAVFGEVATNMEGPEGFKNDGRLLLGSFG